MDKKLAKIAALLTVAALLAAPTLARAFNPATHIYIAERVFDSCKERIDLFYGSTAPDLAFSVANPGKWLTAKYDTHYEFKDLRGYAFGAIQRAFANGWITHNEEWGADYYAHIEYPAGTTPGYVEQKIDALLDHPYLNPSVKEKLSPEFAHYAIEVAIDLLLKKHDPWLGGKLVFANSFRSWQDRHLLVKALVWDGKKTDWLTLAMAELTFRNLVGHYASALALAYPGDIIAIVQLAVKLAQETYGMEVTFAEVLHVLLLAIDVCKADYEGVVGHAIDQIKSKLH